MGSVPKVKIEEKNKIDYDLAIKIDFICF